MDHLQRVQFVVKRYPHLQGLRLLPLGLLFLGSGVWRDGHLRWVDAGSRGSRWFAGAFVLALIAAVTLGRYYRARFGSVQPLPSPRRVIAALGFAAVLAAAVWVQTALDWDVSAPLIVVGTALAYVGIAGGYVRIHYIAVAAGCLLLAIVGTLGVSPHARVVLLDYLTGVGLIAVGIGDHLVLRNTLETYHHARAV